MRPRTSHLPCLALLAWSFTLPTAAAPPLPAGAEDAARHITRSTLEGPIRFLSDDLLEGRGPATRSDALTRGYLAAAMASLGLLPGGADGSWEQPVDVLSVTAHGPAEWSFSTKGGPVSFAWHQDYIAGSGLPEASSGFKAAEVVFVGYGIQAPEYQWDDFKGQDLKGKVLLMLNNDPEDDPKLFAGKTRLYYGRWVYKYESATRQGAAGAIILHTTHSAAYPWQVVQTSWSGPQFELPPAGEPRLPVKAWATEPAVRRLLTSAGHDLDALVAAAQKRDFRPVPLAITTSLELKNTVSKTSTANVIGLLRGSDPKLEDEVVIVSAHHDHLGKGEPDGDKDVIYNGAVDNAAGVAQVLSIAQAMTRLPQPPKRSVMFLFFAAEEQGLLGSRYYAAHPTFHPGKIAAVVNFDGGNIWGKTQDITVIGYGKSSMDPLVTELAAAQGRKTTPDAFPDKGSFYRSDQFNLAKVGVPALYFHQGTDFIGKPEGWGREVVEEWTRVHYHQPSDEWLPEWNFDGMVEDAQLGLFCALSVAENPTLPAWNPGDEFEAARKKALAEAGTQGTTHNDPVQGQPLPHREERAMELGAFSVSLAVKDLEASRSFYEKLGFKAFHGNAAQGWLILKNGDHVIGLFQGMFEKNIMTFNPGWDQNAQPTASFTDVRELQRQLKAQGVVFQTEADPSTTGPASFVVVDPDGNQILVDQHR